MRCMPMYPHEVHARNMHAREVHACEMHVYEVHAHEIRACEINAYEMQMTPIPYTTDTSCCLISFKRSLPGKVPYPGT
jgi:hypothetical protein